MSAHKIEPTPETPRIDSQLLDTLHPIFRTDAFAVFMRNPYHNANLHPLREELRGCKEKEPEWRLLLTQIELLPSESFTTAHRGIFRAEVQSCLHPDRWMKSQSVTKPNVSVAC